MANLSGKSIPLTSEEKRFINLNYDKMSIPKMAKQINRSYYTIKCYMQESELMDKGNALFNVDIFKGEYTWVI